MQQNNINAERTTWVRGQSAPKSIYDHADLRRYARLIERRGAELNAMVQQLPADEKYHFTAGLDDIELQLRGHMAAMQMLLDSCRYRAERNLVPSEVAK